MGEAINLVENFKVENVIFNCGDFNQLEQEFIKVLDKNKIPYYSCIKELNIGDNKLYFLNNKGYGNENDNSNVIYTELNKHKFLFMGDAGIEVEEDLIKKYNFKNIDVLKVGHHGSKTSSGKKYNRRTLFRMKQFYIMFSDGKVSPLATQLSWSHYSELLSIKDINRLMYYINITINNNLSKRELREKIKNKEYERLPIEAKNKLISSEKLEVKDLVPNPILIRNKNNIEIITEKALHRLILEDIESFMKELGNSFSFIGSEYKIKIGDRNHYIDLLLFNIKYNCYVVVELKVTEFKVEFISQVQKYMNYIDKNVKEVSNNGTIGILICKREDKFVIEYCSDNKIAVREYELV